MIRKDTTAIRLNHNDIAANMKNVIPSSVIEIKFQFLKVYYACTRRMVTFHLRN